MDRIDSRTFDQLRVCKFNRDFLTNAQGSVLVEQGNTRVICAVSVVPGVPRWMREQNVSGGWLTSEYQMLPASTADRAPRDVNRGKLNGRAQEIQRFIGRSLRAAVDLDKVGENTIYVDCDVLDADGGTRCASINGSSVALHLAFRKMIDEGIISEMPVAGHVAAISVGVVEDTTLLDLCYKEDSSAGVDMNIVMTEAGQFVELQGAAEMGAFSQGQLDEMIELAKKGIREIIQFQKECSAIGS